MSDEVHHPRFARLYPRLAARVEESGVRGQRIEALSPATGRVVEIGAGHGLDFPHYPRTVTGVLAVEPEPTLRAMAVRAAADAPVPVTVVDGTAERLPAEDASFDTAVCSLVLCSVRDQRAALAEIRRVLRPGGQLLFHEHIRAAGRGFAAYQRSVDLLWPHLAGGCHVSRRTDRLIGEAGFTVRSLRRFRFPPGRAPVPAAPFMIGRAEV